MTNEQLEQKVKSLEAEIATQTKLMVRIGILLEENLKRIKKRKQGE